MPESAWPCRMCWCRLTAGRLARDQSFRGQGVGDLLLADAVKIALAMSEKIASFAVVADAKDKNAARFYAAFGFTPLPETPRRLTLPMQTIQSLSQTFRRPSSCTHTCLQRHILSGQDYAEGDVETFLLLLFWIPEFRSLGEQEKQAICFLENVREHRLRHAEVK